MSPSFLPLETQRLAWPVSGAWTSGAEDQPGIVGRLGEKNRLTVITEVVIQQFVETSVAVYICWLTYTGITWVCPAAKLCECGRGFIDS